MKINRTVQRTIQILSCAAAHPEVVSLDELCEQFSLPKNVVISRLLLTYNIQLLCRLPVRVD